MCVGMSDYGYVIHNTVPNYVSTVDVMDVDVTYKFHGHHIHAFRNVASRWKDKKYTLTVKLINGDVFVTKQLPTDGDLK